MIAMLMVYLLIIYDFHILYKCAEIFPLIVMQVLCWWKPRAGNLKVESILFFIRYYKSLSSFYSKHI